MKLIVALIFVAILSVGAFSQEVQLRAEKGQVIKSPELPAADLEFGKGFKYVGGHRFVLYGVANAEQHFFVDADKNGQIRRMYCVQFEGYLPSNDHTYNYEVTRTVNIGGLDFIADAWATNVKTNPRRPDSDTAKAKAFLESKGYRYGSGEVLAQRLVHLIGNKKRDELMVIYAEDLSPFGVTASDLSKGGKAEAKWPEISAGLLKRAQKDIKIRKK